MNDLFKLLRIDCYRKVHFLSFETENMNINKPVGKNCFCFVSRAGDEKQH